MRSAHPERRLSQPCATAVIKSPDKLVSGLLSVGGTDGEPALSAALEPRLSPVGTTVTCNSDCGDERISKQTKTEAELGPQLTNASQLYWHLEFSAGGESTIVETLANSLPRHSFEGSPSEVCVKASWVDPLDGTTGELDEVCLSTATLPLGISDEVYRPDSLFFCEAPPSGFESEWCATLADSWCSSSTQQCANYESTCSDPAAGGADGGAGGEGGESNAPAPGSGASPTATGGNSAGSGGKSTSTGGKSAGAGEPSGGTGSDETDPSGCNCSVGPTRSSSSFLGMIGLLGVGALFTLRSRKSVRA